METNPPLFPKEIQAHIASYLSDQDIATYRAVNEHWRNILSPLCWHRLKRFHNLNFYRGAQFKYLRRILEHVEEPLSLTIVRGDLTIGTELQELRKLTNLYYLRFIQCRFQGDYIQQLAQFTKLTGLNDYHNYNKVEPQDYAHFSTLTNLRQLSIVTEDTAMHEFLMAHLTDLTNLEGLPFLLNGDSIVQLAAHFKNLTQISISGNIVTDNGIRNLTSLTNLKFLGLDKCSSISDSVVKHFSTLTKLNNIAIDSCSALTTDALTGFSRCTQLEHFTLVSSPHIDSLSPLISCINLKSLKLSQCYLETWGLAPLRNFEQLTELDCRNFLQLKDPALKYFTMTSLRTLNLGRDANITDEGLKFLSDLTDLQHLELGICEKITDFGLKHLERLVGLTYLGMLSLVRITDIGVKCLTGLTNLKHLDLSACRVTDASVRLFVNNKLDRLDIFNCTNITSEGIALRDMITNYDYYFGDNF